MHRAFRGASSLVPQNESLTFPIRAAFYFPWYPENWNQFGYTPFTRYTPTLGYYDQHEPDIFAQHLAWATYANLDALIFVWRGLADGTGISATTFNSLPDSSQLGTDEKLPHMLDQCLQHGIKTCILYEIEGYANPTQGQIEYEFAYLTTYFAHPAYLRVDGRPVVFVYNNTNTDNATALKYYDATNSLADVYLMMGTQSEVQTTTPLMDGYWGYHRENFADIGNTYSICPGFWRVDDEEPVTTRDLSRWHDDIADLVASGEEWHLIISFNEWGEGSGFEPTDEYGTDYLDALATGLA